MIRVKGLVTRTAGRARGIRGRFVCYFVLGMALSLAASYVLGNAAAKEVIGRINTGHADANLRQMTYNLAGLSESLERQMTMLLLSSSTKALMNSDLYTELELIKELREYIRMADSILTNFPHIHSIYLFLSDGDVIGVTRTNMRHSLFAWQPIVGPALREINQKAGYALRLHGGLYSTDFPIPANDEPLIPLISAVKKSGGHVMIFNVLETHVSGMYSGAAYNGSGAVRLTDSNEMIISSMDKSEIRTSYPGLTRADGADLGDGLYMAVHGENQVFWRREPKLDITVVSEIPLSASLGDIRRIQASIIGSLSIALSVLCAAVVMWMTRAFRPLEALKASMRRVETGDYSQSVPVVGNDELSLLAEQHNAMLVNLARLTDRNRHAEEEKRASELKALRNQINPHFLYNSLNTIKWMALIAGNEQVAESLAALGGIIAPLFRADRPTCALSEEIRTVDGYLEIMNKRFGGRIQLILRIDPRVADRPVLRLLLQPLVENAVVHGFLPENRGGTIEIEAFLGTNRLIITVTDDGVGIDAGQLERLNRALARGDETEGVGMMNTNRRIRLHYGDLYGIELYTVTPHGLSARVELPLLDE